MPRGDRTGPDGRGPMTGRGAGICAGFSFPEFKNSSIRGGGTGMGCGYRRGFGGGYSIVRGDYIGYNADAVGQGNESGVDEQKALKSQADYLEESLKQVNQRIKDLEEQNSRSSS